MAGAIEVTLQNIYVNSILRSQDKAIINGISQSKAIVLYRAGSASIAICIAG